MWLPLCTKNTSQPFDFTTLASELSAIHHSCFEKGWKAQDFLDYLKCENALVAGQFMDGKLGGFICLSLIPPETEILTIAVSPNYQGQGFGKSLFESAKEKLPTFGINKIFLEVSVKNTSAQKFYISLGFTEFSTRKDYYAPGEDAILMDFTFA